MNIDFFFIFRNNFTPFFERLRHWGRTFSEGKNILKFYPIYFVEVKRNALYLELSEKRSSYIY